MFHPTGHGAGDNTFREPQKQNGAGLARAGQFMPMGSAQPASAACTSFFTFSALGDRSSSRALARKASSPPR